MRALEDSEIAARALSRLRVAGAVLTRDAARGDFALLPRGDRRRRPTVRVPTALVQQLAREGALIALETGDRFALSDAGRARAIRVSAGTDEQYRAQHDAIVPRIVMDSDGDARPARGVDPAGPLARLERLADAKGKPYLASAEISAAHRLRGDWEAGQQGLVGASDWSAPPRGATARGSGGGVEAARASAVDARRRCERALAALAPILASAVRAACLHEQGLAEIERAHEWPARAGKLALKCALAQLAEHYRRG